MTKPTAETDAHDPDMHHQMNPTQPPGDGAAQGDSPLTVDELVAMDLPPEVMGFIEQLMAERDEAIDGRKRAQADFVNFQRRATENEVRATRGGVTTVVRSMIGVLDHFDLALEQDLDQVTVDQLVAGIRMIRQELLKALECHAIKSIRPEAGDDFDPNLHQAVMREHTDNMPPDRVVHVMQMGYIFEDVVLRPASVTVSALPEAGPE